LRGATFPSWTWSEECFVAAFRAGSARSARDLEMLSPLGHGPKMPLGRTRRAALDVEDVDLDGIRAERYRPKGPVSGSIVYLHGGGFVTGTIGSERQLAAEQSIVSNCDTYNVAYRLAPRHPFPAALDDAIAAYRAILDRGADPATTILFGGSAGAALALATLVRIRDRGLPRPAGAVLLSPYADFTFGGDSVVENSRFDMLPLQDLGSIWGPAYVGTADPADPSVSPALADLDGLPPLLILAGGAETLLSCAERIAAKARHAGVDTQFTVYPEKVHGWMLMPKLAASVAAVAEVNDWIDERLRAQAPAARPEGSP
jgi:monoterpene epsilon-lactone hydrolase